MSAPFTLIGDPAAEACGPDGCAIPATHPALSEAQTAGIDAVTSEATAHDSVSNSNEPR
ncbi:hypothetical protein [Mycetocola tolaasinivorans]|uniref:hypothetical protein n=1 Tax=Mycetocola tolaasinivorans TaxID=76635 RepID=UPI0015FFFFD1|nr:hypothetical protein [Mycetocola tolaasinivorans]